MGVRLVDRIKEEGFDIVRFESNEYLLSEYREMNPAEKRSFLQSLSKLIDELEMEKEGTEESKLFIENNSRFYDKASYWQTHDKFVASKMITDGDLIKFHDLLEEIRKIDVRKK